MQPEPQPKPARQTVDDPRIALIDVLNPSIVLMDWNKTLQVLLSRNTLVEQRSIELQGVRLIEIPLGWRLALIRLVSCFHKVRLPDEHEFDTLQIDAWKTPSPVLSGNILIGQVSDTTKLIQLTAAEYMSLSEMNGRSLHRWVVRRFGLGFRPAADQSLKHRRAA